MADMIRKLMPVEVKEVADRTLEIAGSTEDKDRMGDIIRASGWKLGPFKKNPVFMWAHNYDQPPIGRAEKVWVDKETNRLMFRVEFAGPEIYEFADTIYKLYKGGFLHATSVGFIPLDWEGKDEENATPKWEGNVFTKQELLELSAVPVPANANALVTAREQGLITVKEFEAVNTMVAETDQALTTAITVVSDENIEGEEGDAATITKPYPNEHACRLKDPAQYDTCRRSERTATEPESAKGKKYTVIFCKKEDGPMEEQAYRYDKEDWTAAQAGAHCKAHDGKFEPASDEESIPTPKPITQEQLCDDLDYCLDNIRQCGMNETTLEAGLSIASEIIMRATGSDIPDDILDKVGAVLNQKNRERLTEIQRLAQAVLDSAEKPAEDGDKQLEAPEPEVDPKVQRAQDVAEVTQHVIARITGKRIK